jgi:sulfate/thiosulfate transport system permease protein
LNTAGVLSKPLRQPSVLPGFGLTFGFTTFFLSAIVLLPLAALVLMAARLTWGEFFDVILDARAVGSYRLSFGASLLAATINLVFGFVIPGRWCATNFPARRSSTR